jgi:hypothetical protein
MAFAKSSLVNFFLALVKGKAAIIASSKRL